MAGDVFQDVRDPELKTQHSWKKTKPKNHGALRAAWQLLRPGPVLWEPCAVTCTVASDSTGPRLRWNELPAVLSNHLPHSPTPLCRCG
jgi:hypothetical protein